MIVIQTGYNPTVPLTHSRIGMNNITRTGTATASTTATGFSANAPKNGLTYEYWRPTSMPATWAIDAGVSVSVNYCGIAAHELGSKSATVTVQYSTDNSSWTTLDSSSPTDDSPLMFLFAPVSARYWRISISGAVAPSIGVVYFGTTLDMQRPCYAGLSPINFSRETVLRTNRSEGGQFLGRSVIRQGSSMSVGFRHLDYSWYKTNFDPFVKDALSYPFFFAWRPDGYPEQVGYVWTLEDIKPSTMGIRDLVEVSFNMVGLAVE
jgi:hypothetical protein